LAICGSIVQADHYLLDNRDTGSSLRMLVVLALGAAASITFRSLIRFTKWGSVARYAWAASDLFLFTTLVFFQSGVKTSLVVGYFVLIAASGLWFRERLVWFTTALALFSYGLLVIEEGRRAGHSEPLHRHGLFMAVMVLAALIIAYQVKRVRSLSLYYENRQLP
jgi:serine/threonine-protein kinase